MVDEKITDGKRIAQLLASELNGLESGVLNSVSVVDAEPDAAPDESGSEAYRIVYGESPVAVVSMFPTETRVTFRIAVPWPEERRRPETVAESGTALVISSGAEVKRAVDAIRPVLDELSEIDHGDETGSERA